MNSVVPPRGTTKGQFSLFTSTWVSLDGGRKLNQGNPQKLEQGSVGQPWNRTHNLLTTLPPRPRLYLLHDNLKLSLRSTTFCLMFFPFAEDCLHLPPVENTLLVTIETNTFRDRDPSHHQCMRHCILE